MKTDKLNTWLRRMSLGDETRAADMFQLVSLRAGRVEDVITTVYAERDSDEWVKGACEAIADGFEGEIEAGNQAEFAVLAFRPDAYDKHVAKFSLPRNDRDNTGRPREGRHEKEEYLMRQNEMMFRGSIGAQQAIIQSLSRQLADKDEVIAELTRNQLTYLKGLNEIADLKQERQIRADEASAKRKEREGLVEKVHLLANAFIAKSTQKALPAGKTPRDVAINELLSSILSNDEQRDRILAILTPEQQLGLFALINNDADTTSTEH